MKFFFPDSLDLVDPSFDFEAETRSPTRIRQRDDLYPHEIFAEAPYDGLLVSKAIVDGLGGGGAGRYTVAQRHRLLRGGVREFFRLGDRKIKTMGDCGAFTYVREDYPPFSVDEVISFYDACDFDYGLSVDHVIVDFNMEYDRPLPGFEVVPEQWRRRQEITLTLASEFFEAHRAGKCRFEPLGVAQGWSPASYAHAVTVLQNIGFRYIALGGLVPLKTREILAALEAAARMRGSETRFHLLGITRCDHVNRFAALGAISFDSTSPLRQAFKDDKDNYYTLDRTYTAVRVPQVEGNPKLQRAIKAGKVNFEVARKLEQACLQSLCAYGQRRHRLESMLNVLDEYEELYNGSVSRRDVYREVLEARPWEQCACEVCQVLGIHVIIFRGAERNRRRGFHNLFTFHKRLMGELSAGVTVHRERNGPRATKPMPKLTPLRESASLRLELEATND